MDTKNHVFPPYAVSSRYYLDKFRATVLHWYRLFPGTEGTVMAATCHVLCEDTSLPLEPQNNSQILQNIPASSDTKKPRLPKWDAESSYAKES
jgi:hypothetical protein